MTRCPSCDSQRVGRLGGRYLLVRCLDCGNWWPPSENGRSNPSAEITLPPGVSALHVVLAALRDLQDEHGAIVEEVDMRPDGGSIVLRVPVGSRNGRPALRSVAEDTDDRFV